MASQSPQSQQTPSGRNTPIVLKNVPSSLSYQTGVLEGARLAVLQDLGSYIPMIPFRQFLDHLAPRVKFDLNSTMKLLNSDREFLLHSDQWYNFPEDNTEKGVFGRMSKIFSRIVTAVIENSGGQLKEDDRTTDFLQNPDQAPTSVLRCSKHRPDGYFVLKDRQNTDGIFWADIVLSCEYKLVNSEESLDDVCIHRGLCHRVLG